MEQILSQYSVFPPKVPAAILHLLSPIFNLPKSPARLRQNSQIAQDLELLADI